MVLDGSVRNGPGPNFGWKPAPNRPKLKSRPQLPNISRTQDSLRDCEFVKIELVRGRGLRQGFLGRSLTRMRPTIDGFPSGSEEVAQTRKKKRMSYLGLRNRAPVPEIVLWGLHGPLLPQNHLEKVGADPPNFPVSFAVPN